MTQIPRVLSIAGTDPTGGAGIQADLKSIAAAGGYGMCVVTALVAQNTMGVREIHTPPVEFLRAQLDAVSDDVTIDAIKVGMLASAAIADTVGRWLDDVDPDRTIPFVLDPVMVATSGDRLLEQTAEDAVARLAARASVITPNLKELAVLAGTPVRDDLTAAIDDARAWAERTGTAVIVKGGHLTTGDPDNAVVMADGVVHRVSNPRVDTQNTHGTGCSLSSALATRLGAGDDLTTALEWSTSWLHDALVGSDALHVGHGHSPVDHMVRFRTRGLVRAV